MGDIPGSGNESKYELDQSEDSAEGVVLLNYSSLEEIPQSLLHQPQCCSITHLYLKRNRLKTLPCGIKDLSSLVDLYLHSNELVSLPDSIGELCHLQSLDVSVNHLTELPRTIGKLTSLKKLALYDNLVRYLPKEIGCLRKLETLDVMKNELTCVPPEVGQCVNLRRLCLDKNKIKLLPRQLCKLENLEELSLCSMCLLCIPFNLCKLSSLTSLCVDDNPHLTALPWVIDCDDGNGCVVGPYVDIISTHRCATGDPGKAGEISSLCGVRVKNMQDEYRTVLIPPEIEKLGNIRNNCVPCLKELSLRFLARELKGIRQLYTCMCMFELPRPLRDLVLCPPVYCAFCFTPVFVMAFPVPFRHMYHHRSMCAIALCCSVECAQEVIHSPGADVYRFYDEG